jgi:hypothetical protein
MQVIGFVLMAIRPVFGNADVIVVLQRSFPERISEREMQRVVAAIVLKERAWQIQSPSGITE